jgi:hypothetical protein
MDRRELLKSGSAFALGAQAGRETTFGTPAGLSDVLFDKGGAVVNVMADGYGIRADGSDVSAAVVRLVTMLPARGATLLFPPGQYVFGAPVAFPPSVTVALLRGARLEPALGVTLRIAGDFAAGAYHIFGGAGRIELDGPSPGEVCPEWWGAMPSMNGASPANSTAAIQRALDTGRSVRLARGVYGLTSVSTRANGQALRGAGTWVDNDDPAGGTKLVRLGGAEVAVLVNNYMGQRLEGLTIDGGTGRGDLVRDTGKNTVISHVRMQRTVSGYCLHLSGTNLCHYRDLYFPDRLNGREVPSFGHIRCDNALYSTFSSCAAGMVSGGAHLRIQHCTGLRFEGHYADPAGGAAAIQILGSTRNIQFSALNLESVASAAPLVVVDADTAGGDIRDIRFSGMRVLQTAPTAQPVMRFVGGAGSRLSMVVVDGLTVQDSASGSRSLVELDGVRNSRFDNVEIEYQAAFTFIDCTGARSAAIRSSNTYARGAGLGRNRWKVAGLFVDSSGFRQEFIPGNEGATLINIATEVHTAGAGPGGVVAIGGGTVTDDGELALAAGETGLSLRVFRQDREPQLAIGSVALWLRPDGGVFLVARPGAGAVRRVQLQ